MNEKEINDFVFYLMLGMIIGSRLFMILWMPGYYLSDLGAIFRVWEGGMSFHGGLVGVIAAGYLYCKKHNKSFWRVADIISIPSMFGLALGRIANFVNGELWGTVTDVSWCVVFKGAHGCRHPVQLYAAAKRFLILGYLSYISRSEHKEGYVFMNLVLWEGAGRFLVDFFRDNERFIGLSLGQWMSIVMVVWAVYMLKFYKNKK